MLFKKPKCDTETPGGSVRPVAARRRQPCGFRRRRRTLGWSPDGKSLTFLDGVDAASNVLVQRLNRGKANRSRVSPSVGSSGENGLLTEGVSF